jgi:hypothetical protein
MYEAEQREGEREVNDNRRVETKKNWWGRSERHFMGGEKRKWERSGRHYI